MKIDRDSGNSVEFLKKYSKMGMDKGNPISQECIDVLGQTYSINNIGFSRVLSLEDEWYEDVRYPEEVIRVIQSDQNSGVDIFSFWQRFDNVPINYNYYKEWEAIAVLPIKSYEHWLAEQIRPRVRSQIRKAEREGVVVREVEYSDEFARGMTKIFNESPVRQGRRFWHYGKDFDTVKEQFSRYIFREYMIGAYYDGEMIGFVMLGDAGGFGLTGQIISSIHHRDKSTNNLLIAKAVDVCVSRGLGYLVYLYWGDDSLAEFKRRCGFERRLIPRYYVPLSARGRLSLAIGSHRGWKNMLPPSIKSPLKRVRRMWNELYH